MANRNQICTHFIKCVCVCVSCELTAVLVLATCQPTLHKGTSLPSTRVFAFNTLFMYCVAPRKVRNLCLTMAIAFGSLVPNASPNGARTHRGLAGKTVGSGGFFGFFARFQRLVRLCASSSLSCQGSSKYLAGAPERDPSRRKRRGCRALSLTARPWIHRLEELFVPGMLWLIATKV